MDKVNNMDTNNKTNEKPLSQQSPDEAKQTVKDKVSRGVATVAGALEGFANQMRENDLGQTTKEAVKQVGETTREVAATTREEGMKVKEAVTGQGSSGSTGSQKGAESRNPPGGSAGQGLGGGQAGPSQGRSGGLSGSQGLGGSGGAGSAGSPGSSQIGGLGRRSDQNAHGSMRDPSAGQGVGGTSHGSMGPSTLETERALGEDRDEPELQDTQDTKATDKATDLNRR